MTARLCCSSNVLGRGLPICQQRWSIGSRESIFNHCCSIIALYLLPSAIVMFDGKFLFQVGHLFRCTYDSDTIIVTRSQKFLSVGGPKAGCNRITMLKLQDWFWLPSYLSNVPNCNCTIITGASQVCLVFRIHRDAANLFLSYCVH